MKRLFTPRRIAFAALALAVEIAFAAWLLSGVAAAPTTGSIDNLGDSLIDEDLAKAFAPPAQPKPGREADGEGSPGWLPDEELLRRLMDQETGAAPRNGGAGNGGEDVGASPLAGVVAGMRRAEQRLGGAPGAELAVPIQRQVVADLEELIAQMEKQCQGGQCKNPSEQKKQASQRSKPKPGKAGKPGAASQAKSTQAARSSTTQLRSASSAGAKAQPPAELMKAAWGHLPERVREQMLQASSDEFLPEYREQLEAYYRRLAEREADGNR